MEAPRSFRESKNRLDDLKGRVETFTGRKSIEEQRKVQDGNPKLPFGFSNLPVSKDIIAGCLAFIAAVVVLWKWSPDIICKKVKTRDGQEVKKLDLKMVGIASLVVGIGVWYGYGYVSI